MPPHRPDPTVHCVERREPPADSEHPPARARCRELAKPARIIFPGGLLIVFLGPWPARIPAGCRLSITANRPPVPTPAALSAAPRTANPEDPPMRYRQ